MGSLVSRSDDEVCKLEDREAVNDVKEIAECLMEKLLLTIRKNQAFSRIRVTAPFSWTCKVSASVLPRAI